MTGTRQHSNEILAGSQRAAILAQILVMAALIAAMAPATQAQTFTILHNFTGGADGYYPSAGLIFDGSANLYGGAGPAAIFRLKLQGAEWVFSPIFEFNGSDGDFLHGRLTVGPDGALYGASYFGGIPDCADGAGCGLIFSLRPPRTFCGTPFCFWTQTALYEFNPLNLPSDGYFPNGGIVFDTAGKLYGTTDSGGLQGQGTVYELTPSQSAWVETVVHGFTGGLDGGIPNAGMVIDDAGNLYGTTYAGGDPTCYPGPNSCGVVFELSPTSSGWVETVLHTFQSSDGAFPLGGLISDRNGNLYGTTSIGGSNGGGTVFELSPSGGGWTFNVLYNFSGNPRSQVGPEGLLAIDASGNLYGVTNSEGSQSAGNLFKLTPNGGHWTYTDVHDFAISPTNGAFPFDGPTLDPNGNIYGTSGEGGTGTCSYGCGVVYKITP